MNTTSSIITCADIIDTMTDVLLNTIAELTAAHVATLNHNVTKTVMTELGSSMYDYTGIESIEAHPSIRPTIYPKEYKTGIFDMKHSLYDTIQRPVVHFSYYSGSQEGFSIVISVDGTYIKWRTWNGGRGPAEVIKYNPIPKDYFTMLCAFSNKGAGTHSFNYIPDLLKKMDDGLKSGDFIKHREEFKYLEIIKKAEAIELKNAIDKADLEKRWATLKLSYDDIESKKKQLQLASMSLKKERMKFIEEQEAFKKTMAQTFSCDALLESI